MVLVIDTKLKVWRRPFEQSSTPLVVSMLEPTPTCEALLIPMRATCREENRMEVLLDFLSNDSAASSFGLLVVTGTSLQKTLWVLGVGWCLGDVGR